MKLKALKTGSITDKNDNVIRFWPGKIIEVKKSDFEIDFDKHPSFEKPGEDDQKKGK